MPPRPVSTTVVYYPPQWLERCGCARAPTRARFLNNASSTSRRARLSRSCCLEIPRANRPSAQWSYIININKIRGQSFHVYVIFIYYIRRERETDGQTDGRTETDKTIPKKKEKKRKIADTLLMMGVPLRLWIGNRVGRIL